MRQLRPQDWRPCRARRNSEVGQKECQLSEQPVTTGGYENECLRAYHTASSKRHLVSPAAVVIAHLRKPLGKRE